MNGRDKIFFLLKDYHETLTIKRVESSVRCDTESDTTPKTMCLKCNWDVLGEGNEVQREEEKTRGTKIQVKNMTL